MCRCFNATILAAILCFMPMVILGNDIGLANVKAESTRHLSERLYRKGLAALNAGNLTKPMHSNAYDYFSAIKTLDPNNVLAKHGLERVADKYQELIFRALQSGDGEHAGKLLQRALWLFPAHPALLNAKSRLKEALKPTANFDITRVHDEQLSRFDLPSAELRRKTANIKGMLVAVSQRLLKTGEFVIIHARNDAEGRWIYKELKQGAKGYRVRGDILIDKVPRLELQAAPIKE